MRSITSKRQTNLTLRQYITNSSLKKRVASRNNSKDAKQSANQQLKGPIQSINNEFLRPDALVEQIKLFLAQNIQQQCKLATILGMFDKLIEIFNRQLNDKNCEYGLLETMINEKSRPYRKQDKVIEDVYVNKKVYTQPQQVIGYKEQIPQKRQRKNSTIEVYNYISDSRSSANDEVPNINVLTLTRNLQRDLETQQTLTSNHKSCLQQSKVSIQLDYDYNQLSSLLSSNNKFIAPKKQKSQFQSLNSSFSKTPQSSALSKFQSFKRRVVK